MTAVSVSRTVAASPEQAFRAFTDADELAAWWWPQLPGTQYELHVVIDGHFEIRNDVAAIGVRGRYLAVDRPKLLSFTWQWLTDGEPDGPEDSVEVAFTPDAGGTTITVTHTTTDPSAENWRQGWSDCLDRLVAAHA